MKYIIVPKSDIFRKREEFAISLRKKNKDAKLSKLRAKIQTKTKPLLNKNDSQ